MNLKGVILASKPRVVNPGLNESRSRNQLSRINFFVELNKQVSYQKIAQTLFGIKLIKRVRTATMWSIYLTLILGGWSICLFCSRLYSRTRIKPELSLGIEVCEELLKEMNLCKVSLITKREASGYTWRDMLVVFL